MTGLPAQRRNLMESNPNSQQFPLQLGGDRTIDLGPDLLIARHGGVEAGLARRSAGVPESLAAKYASVFQSQNRIHSALRMVGQCQLMARIIWLSEGS